jgi:tRNA(Arg) A34 adenosine deaminase TadA
VLLPPNSYAKCQQTPTPHELHGQSHHNTISPPLPITFFSPSADGSTESGQLNMSTEPETPLLKSLADFDIYNWKADPSISFDENVMDLVMILTRNSDCRQGHMACILAHPPNEVSTKEDLTKIIEDSIISAEINRPLYKPRSSDIHAEIGALGRANRMGRTTEGCTAFITMPPCKTCFGALVASGTKRIVSRLRFLPPVSDTAEGCGIVLTHLSDEDSRLARTNTIIYGHPEGRKRSNPASDFDEIKK